MKHAFGSCLPLFAGRTWVGFGWFRGYGQAGRQASKPRVEKTPKEKEKLSGRQAHRQRYNGLGDIN